MDKESKYWFPAKRYGWGWGIPTCWQGWAVLLGYIALILAAPSLFLPEHLTGYYIYVGILTAGLITVCYKKGEPPKWRWGK